MKHLAIIIAFTLASIASAHSGGTDSSGCHVGHCHGGGSSSSSSSSYSGSSSATSANGSFNAVPILVTLGILGVAGGLTVFIIYHRSQKKTDYSQGKINHQGDNSHSIMLGLNYPIASP